MSDVAKVVDLTNVYYVVGVMVIFNLGTIGSVVWALLKASWWLSKLDSRVSQNTKDINNAHQKIRDVQLAKQTN